MTEAILTSMTVFALFGLPCVAVAVLDQIHLEKERKRRELALLREMELETLKYETWAQAERYYQTCRLETARNSLKRSGQQVDKEKERYAKMAQAVV
ncbi:TPA: hypothetical protein U1317_001938 [Streptococcus suis]|nr:hypothetical protein [Streptococcus suis]HEM5178646.1 hypothetical protein [Streptococcus suis]